MFWHPGRTHSVSKFDTQTLGEELYRVEIEKLQSTLQKTDQESHHQLKWKEFIHSQCILDLEPSDYHLFPQLLKE